MQKPIIYMFKMASECPISSVPSLLPVTNEGDGLPCLESCPVGSAS